MPAKKDTSILVTQQDTMANAIMRTEGNKNADPNNVKLAFGQQEH